MKDPLPDKTVILYLISTVMLIFILIFSLRPNQQDLQPSIEWRDYPDQNNKVIQL